MDIVTVDPVGLLKLEFIDQNNEKFTESPFYVRANLMTNNAAATNAGEALYNAVKRVVSGDFNLTTAAYTSSSMTYTVGVDQFDQS